MPCRFQFRLRTVFVLTTPCAVPFAGLGWWSHKARQMRNTADAIIESGGSINFAWDHQPTHWPVWLIKLLGKDYFLHIETVFFSEEGTDESLVLLKGLTQLERLNLQNSQVTDAGLEHIKGVTSLKGGGHGDRHSKQDACGDAWGQTNPFLSRRDR